MDDIIKIQDKIIDEFNILGDWFDKYNYLIKIGRKLTPYDATLKNDKYLIKGCQNQVWIVAKLVNNGVIFEGESDAQIIKGMMALIFRVFNNQTIEKILNSEFYLFSKLGLNSSLSPSRVNGLKSILENILFQVKHLSDSSKI